MGSDSFMLNLYFLSNISIETHFLFVWVNLTLSFRNEKIFTGPLGNCNMKELASERESDPFLLVHLNREPLK